MIVLLQYTFIKIYAISKLFLANKSNIHVCQNSGYIIHCTGAKWCIRRTHSNVGGYQCWPSNLNLFLPISRNTKQHNDGCPHTVHILAPRVYNVERVSNAPLPCRKHSRECNEIVTRPKTARYDVYTLIKTGIDRRCLLPPLPMSSRNPQ